jgi:DNA invertase Pin-like site-specific DNA recombinase
MSIESEDTMTEKDNVEKAFAYVRVSSKGQVEGDGFTRQREAINRFAAASGIEIVAEYADAFTGTSENREQFNEMIAAILANGVRAIVVENLTRLARMMAVQEQLATYLASKGIALYSADTGENITEAIMGDPMKKAMVQMQGVFSELEKSTLVRKLRGARERIRAAEGRCEGIKPFGSLPGEETVLEALRGLARKPKGMPRPTWPAVADAANAAGLPTRSGRPWSSQMVRRIVLR